MQRNAEGLSPRSSRRATRSISTLVLPDPALAVTNADASGSAARRWASSARAKESLIRRAEIFPFRAPREMIVIAAVGDVLWFDLRAEGVVRIVVIGQALLERGERVAAGLGAGGAGIDFARTEIGRCE